ncbi:MAG: hypothetical protein V4722_27600 [Bacteroidota bacterium]
MEAIKTRGIAKDGILTVQVPHQFDEQELEVIVLSGNGEKGSPDGMLNDNIQQNLSKKEDLKAFFGSARFPDYPTDKYDVYDQ